MHNEPRPPRPAGWGRASAPLAREARQGQPGEHGSGGSELATGCDLVYVAEDARIGYPAVRFGTPDMQYHAWLMGMRRGMELMLTGDAMTGIEEADWGFANRAFPADQLEAQTMRIAQRIANIPSDVLQVNKRTIHRAMDQMGMRQALRAPSCPSSTPMPRASASSSTTSGGWA